MTGTRGPLHPAVEGFARCAETYERARPGYPNAAVRHLVRRLGIGPRRTVVELGSGTGKLTRALVPFGPALVAVEPTSSMRSVFARAVPDVLLLPGRAEAIPLPARIADAVVAAQAFHWFRPRTALREIARVLRPGGGLGLLWNTRDDTFGVSRRLTRILNRYRGEVPSAHDRGWRAALRSGDASFGPPEEAVFRFAQRLTPRALVDRALSVSFVALLPARERRRALAEVAELVATDPATRGRRRIDLPYTTRVVTAPLRR